MEISKHTILFFYSLCMSISPWASQVYCIYGFGSHIAENSILFASSQSLRLGLAKG